LKHTQKQNEKNKLSNIKRTYILSDVTQHTDEQKENTGTRKTTQKQQRQQLNK
jgi:hypothetical protein